MQRANGAHARPRRALHRGERIRRAVLE